MDPRHLRGAVALREIADRLKTAGEGFEAGAPSTGWALRRPASSVAPRRPMRTATRHTDPLVDIHFDGVHLIVTTETEGPGAKASVEEMRLILRSGTQAERAITLPCRVKPETLRVHVVNGILEATMAPEDSAG